MLGFNALRDFMIRTPRANVFHPALVVTFMSALGLATLPLTAQTYPLMPDEPGKWRPDLPIKLQFEPGSTSVDQASATKWASQLLDVVHRTPYLTKPVGIEVVSKAAAGLDNLDHTAGLKRTILMIGMVQVSANPYEKTPQGAQPNSEDAAASIRIAVNDLSPINPGGLDEFFKDDQGRFYSTTKDLSGTNHGYPVYSDTVLMTRNKVPVLIPVSRGRYVQAKIVRFKERVANANARRAKLAGSQTIPTAMSTLDEAIDAQQNYLDKLKAQYAAMTAAERDAPAIVTNDGGATNIPEFGEPGDADGTHIVYINPALIDEKLPRSAVQILAVTIWTNKDLWPGLSEKLDQQLDWSALAKILQ